MSISSTGTELAESGTAASGAWDASRSLRFRLASGFGLFAVLLAAALAFLIGELATNLARKEIGRYLTRLSIEMRDKLDTGMAERFSEIGMLANLDAAFNGPANPGWRRATVNELKRSMPDYSWIGYTDAGGRVVLALDGLLEGQDVSSRPWFKGALNGPFVGDVHDAKLLAKLLPRVGNGPPRFVDVAYPLGDKGRVTGTLGAHVSWEWAARLRDSIESYAQPENPYEVLVVSSEGLVLLGPKGMTGTKLSRDELAPSQLRFHEAKLERWPDGDTYLTGSSTTRGFGEYRGLGWSVIARQRADYAFAPVRLLQQRIALAGGLVALLAIVLGWWIASRVSRPLTEISRAADAVSRGNRRVQIPSAGGYAEIDQLSASLRTMLRNLSAHEEELRQAQDRLEARVRERTAELAKARAAIELESAERAVARDEAAAAKDQLALAMDASRLVLWDYDVRSGQIQLSDAWAALLGGEPGPSTETMASLTGLVPEEDRAAVQAAVAAALKGPVSHYRVEHRVRTAAGIPIWIVSEGRVVERTPEGFAARMVGTNRDITERVRATNALRESEERFRGAMESSPVGMAIADTEGHWLKVNPALSRITGYSQQELLRLSFRDLTHPDDQAIAPERLRELLHGERDTYQIEKRYVHKLGHAVWVQVNVSLMRDAEGQPNHLISQTIDISERRKLQEKIERLALHDTLTGLPNLRLLLDRLEQTLAAARRTKQPMGIMYMDLDGFKPVNDRHGHAAGDLVLKEFAARVKQVLREADTFARIGGDEFVALLGQINGEEDARRAAERVLAVVSRPFDLGNAQAHLSASVGIALFPAHGDDAQALMEHADAAMYTAKHAGKNSYRLYAGEEK